MAVTINIIINIIFLCLITSCYCVKCPEKCNCWYPSATTTLSIDCSKRNLNETLSQWPENQTNVIVSYAHNSLVELTKLPATNAVISLTFKNCSLRNIEENVFINVVHLRFLDLSYNELHYEDLIPEVFRGPYNEDEYETIGIEELNLAYNKITSLDIKIFEHCPNLTVLDLSGNPLHIVDEGSWFAINSLYQLKNLNLSNTCIASLPEKQILNNRLQLTSLDLSDNLFEGVPKVLGTMSESLEVLSLRNNPIKEINDSSFIGLINLRELWISDMTALHTIKHNSFSNLKHLQMLHLDRNPNLTDIHENAFGISENWPPIIELYINDNNLTELSPNLLNWTMIEISKFDGNDWACECKKLPCVCKDVTILTKNIHIDTEVTNGPVSKLNKSILIIVPIFLFFVGGIFFWRILKKYRTRRAVNSLYPIIYTNAPTHIH